MTKIQNYYKAYMNNLFDTDEYMEVLYILYSIHKKSIQQAINFIVSEGFVSASPSLPYAKRIEEELDNANALLTMLFQITPRILQLKLAISENTGLFSKKIIYLNADAEESEALKKVASYYINKYYRQYKEPAIIKRYYYDNFIDFPKELNHITDYMTNIPYTIDTNFLHVKRIMSKGKRENKEETSLWRSLANTIDYHEVHFNYQYDTRGRLYPLAYGVNPTGEQWSKTLFKLHPNYVVDNIRLFDPKRHRKDKAKALDYLMKDIAKNNGKLMSEKEILKHKLFSEKLSGKKPLYVLRSIEAYQQIYNNEVCTTLIPLDACSSGLQIQAVVTGDRDLARITNLTSEDKVYDYYSEVIDEFNKLCKENKLRRLYKPSEARDKLKKPIMTHWYNSVAGVKRHLQTQAHYNLFLEAIESKSAGAKALMNYLNYLFRTELKDRQGVSYYMPDGFPVYVPFYTQKAKQLKSPYYSISHVYKIVAPDYQANYRAFVPNVIHSIDAYICRQMIVKAKLQGIPLLTNHDSFSTHPFYMDQILGNYKDILINISETNLMQNILEQIVGRKLRFYPFKDSLDLIELKNAKYPLTA